MRVLSPDPPPPVTAGAGGRVRFAVIGSDGRRSMAWTVWSGRRTSDVYVTARPVGGSWKMSLHQSGHWHSGITAERAAVMTAPVLENDRWDAPPEFARGIRRSVELVLPDAELRAWPLGLTDDKPVVAIPAPGDGYASCIELVFMAPGRPTRLQIDQAFSVASIDLNDLTKLWLLARRVPWTDEDTGWLVEQKRAMLAQLDPAVIAAAAAPRAVLLGKRTNDLRFVLDVACDLAAL